MEENIDVNNTHNTTVTTTATATGTGSGLKTLNAK